MSDFSSRIRHLVSLIPCGSVATYGQIALLAGNPRGARAVVWILRSSSQKYNLPWHRVINSQGVISTFSKKQLQLLQKEGVHTKEWKVDLVTHQWKPSGDINMISISTDDRE